MTLKNPQLTPFVVWLTGLSSAGKTTLAMALESRLKDKNFPVKLIDGDLFRQGLTKDLGFSLQDRNENIRRAAEVAKLFMEEGNVCICSFISPTRDMRNLARQLIGKDHFVEVYINAPLEVCEQRDVKGLYKKAREGQIPDFTGIDSPYEAPLFPDIELKTDCCKLEESIEMLWQQLLELKKFPSSLFPDDIL